MDKPKTKLVECETCGKEFEAEVEIWDGEEVIPRSPAFGGLLRCDECMDQRIKAQESINELLSPAPPSWFDPAYCGERWDDDY